MVLAVLPLSRHGPSCLPVRAGRPEWVDAMELALPGNWWEEQTLFSIGCFMRNGMCWHYMWSTCGALFVNVETFNFGEFQPSTPAQPVFVSDKPYVHCTCVHVVACAV